MAQIAREVEAVMQREMFTPPEVLPTFPGSTSFSSALKTMGTGRARSEGLVRGLHYVLSNRAAQLSGTTEFQTSSFVIELRTDGTLERNAFRVQPVWDKTSDRRW